MTYKELIEEKESLKKDLEKLKDRVIDLEFDVSGYEWQLKDSYKTISILEDEIRSLKESLHEEQVEFSKLDTSTLDKLMMFERLSEHWQDLKMEDIELLTSHRAREAKMKEAIEELEREVDWKEEKISDLEDELYNLENG